jgi:hypothetical protein
MKPSLVAAILAFAYSVFGAVGANVLETSSDARGRGVDGVHARLFVPNHVGAVGDASLVRFSDDWKQAEATIQRMERGRVLVLMRPTRR